METKQKVEEIKQYYQDIIALNEYYGTDTIYEALGYDGSMAYIVTGLAAEFLEAQIEFDHNSQDFQSELFDVFVYATMLNDFLTTDLTALTNRLTLFYNNSVLSVDSMAGRSMILNLVSEVSSKVNKYIRRRNKYTSSDKAKVIGNLVHLTDQILIFTYSLIQKQVMDSGMDKLHGRQNKGIL